MGKLYIIDAMSFIHRAYHAMNGDKAMYYRNKATGELIPTSISYVFINMLAKLQRECKPEYLAAAFDLHQPTFRHQLYPAYKATRPAPAPEILAQIPYIHRILEAFRIAQYSAPGFEADDVIATLTCQWFWSLGETVIVSGDKDLLQLVDGDIEVYDSMKNKHYDSSTAVYMHLGVWPEQVPDFLALTGDTADNVPGAKGIGPAGAVELLRRFKDVETAIAKATAVSSRTQREALMKYKADILLSKQLVTLRTDAPVTLDCDDVLVKDPDPMLCNQLHRELGFNSLRVEHGW